MFKKITFINWLFSIIFSLLFILISIKITLNFKGLYYFDINYLDIPKESSMSVKDIKNNYDYLIDFLNSEDKSEFKIPTLPSSKEGKIHFYEVKNIFMTINNIIKIFLPIFIIVMYYFLSRKKFKILKYTSVCLFSIPAILIIVFMSNFHTVFNMFHSIVFNNNYWIFDIYKDPIINILPEKFFLHCSLLIFFIIIFFSIIFFLIYKHCIKNI